MNKRGFNISNNTQNIRINIAKEATPEAHFNAIDREYGILENIKSGMKYTTGDGNWHDITSDNDIKVKTEYQTPIFVVKPVAARQGKALTIRLYFRQIKQHKAVCQS